MAAHKEGGRNASGARRSCSASRQPRRPERHACESQGRHTAHEGSCPGMRAAASGQVGTSSVSSTWHLAMIACARDSNTLFAAIAQPWPPPPPSRRPRRRPRRSRASVTASPTQVRRAGPSGARRGGDGLPAWRPRPPKQRPNHPRAAPAPRAASARLPPRARGRSVHAIWVPWGRCERGWGRPGRAAEGACARHAGTS